MKLTNKIIALVVLSSLLWVSTMAYANTWSISWGTALTKTQIESLFAKLKSWATLSADEQAKLDIIHKNLGFSWKNGKWKTKGWRHFEDGMRMPPMMDMPELTAEEKTSLMTMSDVQKKAFFETKRTQFEAKIQSHEDVIDKVLNGETLTDTEKMILTEVKKERAERKAKMQEMKAAFDAIKPILDKKINGTTLSADEQKQLDAFRAKFPKKWPHGGHRWPDEDSDDIGK